VLGVFRPLPSTSPLLCDFTGFVSSDECDGPWMPTPLRDSYMLSSRREWTTATQCSVEHPSRPIRNGRFTTRPECGSPPRHRHSQVQPRSVNADSWPTPLAQRYSQSVSVWRTKHHQGLSGQLLHSGRRHCQSTSTTSQPAPLDRSAVST